ncbi:MAG TPA: MaoC family dehydratase [Thermoanaerobaculia bacterium]|nr:MaoC family dehydratase [Thermoanaerobaculia bacterium]
MADQPRWAVGARASLRHTFRREDVAAFAELSGDRNPIHLDDDAARAAGFAGVVVHGALVAGLFSRLLGMDLPGAGTVYLGQELRFRRPVHPGDEVVAEVEVLSCREDKPILELATRASAGGEPAVEGRATVLVRSVRDPR